MGRKPAALLDCAKVVVAIFIALLSTWWLQDPAQAAGVDQYSIYSALEPASGLYEYGQHFDESNVAFGARDWNFTGDNGAAVYVRALLHNTQSTYYRFHAYNDSGDSCGVKVRLSQWTGSSWVDLGGTELHYKHMSTRAGDVWSNYFITGGTSVALYLGTIGPCDVSSSNVHSHHSADVGTTSFQRIETYAVQGQESCWTGSEQSFQCIYNHYGLHSTCSASSGYGGLSGNITQYICQEWGLRYRATSDRVFTASW